MPFISGSYAWEHNRALVYLSQNAQTLFPGHIVNFPSHVIPQDNISTASLVSCIEVLHCNVFVTTAPAYHSHVMQLAPSYPGVLFASAHAQVDPSPPELPNVIVYFGRTFESWFLLGYGLRNLPIPRCLGIVLAYSNPELVACANALQEGLRRGGSNTTVVVSDVSSWNHQNRDIYSATVLHRAFGCGLLGHYTDSQTVVSYAVNNGLLAVATHGFVREKYNESVVLGLEVQWVFIYTAIVSAYLNGSTPPPVMYWGLDLGVVSISSAANSILARHRMHNSLTDPDLERLVGDLRSQNVYTRSCVVFGTCKEDADIGRGGFDPDIVVDTLPESVHECLETTGSVPSSTLVEKSSGRPVQSNTSLKDIIVRHECVPCPAGTYGVFGAADTMDVDDPLLPACLPCPPGYTSQPGSRACTNRYSRYIFFVFGLIPIGIILALLWYGKQVKLVRLKIEEAFQIVAFVLEEVLRVSVQLRAKLDMLPEKVESKWPSIRDIDILVSEIRHLGQTASGFIRLRQPMMLPLRRSVFDFKLLLGCAVIAAGLDQKSTSITFDSLMPSRVYGEENPISQVLTRLLVCSRTFSKSRVNIAVAAHRTHGMNCIVTVVISDDGPGFGSEEARAVFSPFNSKLSPFDKISLKPWFSSPLRKNQSHQSNPLLHLRIGLALARYCAAAINGCLEFSSVSGKGSTFKFTIPLAFAQANSLSDARLTTIPKVKHVTLFSCWSVMLLGLARMEAEVRQKMVNIGFREESIVSTDFINVTDLKYCAMASTTNHIVVVPAFQEQEVNVTLFLNSIAPTIPCLVIADSPFDSHQLGCPLIYVHAPEQKYHYILKDLLKALKSEPSEGHFYLQEADTLPNSL